MLYQIKHQGKRVLNALLRPLGWTLAPLNTPTPTAKQTPAKRETMRGGLLNARELGLNPRTIFDVGVASGTPELYEVFPQSAYMLVEPLREYTPFLEDIITSLDDARYVLAAAGEAPGEIEIMVHPFLPGSSFYLDSSAQDVSNPYNGEPRTVPVTTVDALREQHNLTGPYLIKADVQGAELDVIRGADAVLKETAMILLEVSLFDYFDGSGLFHDVVEFMRVRGFVVYDIVGSIYRPLDDALSNVDVVFVPEDSPLRQHNRFGSVEYYEELRARWPQQFAERSAAITQKIEEKS